MTLMCVEKYKRIGSADDVRTLKRERERKEKTRIHGERNVRRLDSVQKKFFSSASDYHFDQFGFLFIEHWHFLPKLN